jgi:hypothetical protein
MKEKLKEILKKLDKNVTELDNTLSESSLETIYKDLSKVKDIFDDILTELEEFIDDMELKEDKE